MLSAIIRRLCGETAQPVPTIRDTPAGKIHNWPRPFHKMSACDPFTEADFKPMRQAEEQAVGHYHRFKLVEVFGSKKYHCHCGIIYGKARSGAWRTQYYPLQVKEIK